ncbi:hypothetical protein Dimus_007963 [Dionaea muscipula]
MSASKWCSVVWLSEACIAPRRRRRQQQRPVVASSGSTVVGCRAPLLDDGQVVCVAARKVVSSSVRGCRAMGRCGSVIGSKWCSVVWSSEACIAPRVDGVSSRGRWSRVAGRRLLVVVLSSRDGQVVCVAARKVVSSSACGCRVMGRRGSVIGR